MVWEFWSSMYFKGEKWNSYCQMAIRNNNLASVVRSCKNVYMYIEIVNVLLFTFRFPLTLLCCNKVFLMKESFSRVLFFSNKIKYNRENVLSFWRFLMSKIKFIETSYWLGNFGKLFSALYEKSYSLVELCSLRIVIKQNKTNHAGLSFSINRQY